MLPSATEIVCALGATEQLVGISHECDFPQGIHDRPVLTSARIDSSLPSRDIDAAVRDVVHNALSVYVVDDQTLGTLEPDVVVDPLMLGGTWMPELIERAGGTSVGPEPGADAPTVTEAELRALEPEVVVVKPCGFDLDRALSERDILERTVLGVLPESTRVYVTDGNAFFNRPGPRVVESTEIIAACTHPELFADFMTKHDAVIRRLR